MDFRIPHIMSSKRMVVSQKSAKNIKILLMCQVWRSVHTSFKVDLSPLQNDQWTSCGVCAFYVFLTFQETIKKEDILCSPLVVRYTQSKIF